MSAADFENLCVILSRQRTAKDLKMYGLWDVPRVLRSRPSAAQDDTREDLDRA
jgi:hypothetical protein